MRLRHAAAAALLAWTTVVATPGAQGDRCAAARDLVREARARLTADVSAGALADARQTFQRATELCPGFGDAYYFLSLVGALLKDQRTENWRSKAVLHDSSALRTNEPLMGGSTLPQPAVAAPAAGNAPVAAIVPIVTVSPYVRRKLALVIGISRFRDRGIQALQYTSADAKAVAEALRETARFDSVKLLLDEEATRVEILTSIDQLARTAEPEDLVVLYVSSHGSPENLDTAGVNYIVTYDTEVSNLYPTAVEMDHLLRAMNQRIRAARVVAFLDTCYSGGTFRELPRGWASTSRSLASQMGVATDALLRSLQAGARQLVVAEAGASASTSSATVAQGVGRVIFTSSSQAERSWEDSRIGHGYFTYFLLQALAKKGPLSVDQIFAELRQRVPEAVFRDKKQPQHPGMAQFPERANVYLKDRVEQ